MAQRALLARAKRAINDLRRLGYAVPSHLPNLNRWHPRPLGYSATQSHSGGDCVPTALYRGLLAGGRDLRPRVAGEWTYLYRAVDADGQIIDFLLSRQRDAEAARQFLRHDLADLREVVPQQIA